MKYAVLGSWKKFPHSQVCKLLGEMERASWLPRQRLEVIGTWHFAISSAEINKRVLHIVLPHEDVSALAPGAVLDRLLGLEPLMKMRELEVS
jgi:hypothetical protein